MGRDASIPEENYPFSTIDGKPIPLDILKPKGLIYQPVDGTSSAFDIPTTSGVAFMYSSVDCFVKLPDDTDPTPAFTTLPADGVVTNNAIFIPAGHMMTVAVNYGIARAIALDEAGFLIVQMITRWAGVALDQQYKRV